MAGFIRRYGFFPGAETIALIEGVVIVDLPPPGAVQGVGVGTTAFTGEFADVSSAVLADSTGNINTHCKPVEVVSATDMLNKVGGFDSTLGKFGAEMGNGFVAVRNKQFSRLVLQAINIASPLGVRLWRELPTNVSLTSAEPVVPMQAATIAAGTEFKSGANRVRVADRLQFTDDAKYASGIDAAVTPAGLPAATQNVVSAGSDFVAAGVAVGDLLVLDRLGPTPTVTTDAPLTIGAVTANVVSTAGYPAAGFIMIESEAIQYTGITATSFTGLTRGSLGTAAASHVAGSSVTLLNDAYTLRVTAIVSATTLTVERLDGSNFTITSWVTATALPFRLHVARTGDTANGNFALASTAGYIVPARPLDATIAQATTVSPTVTPPAATQSSWDPFSGLKLRTHPTAPGLAFASAVQAPNPANSASLDALYATAIDAFLGQELPEREVNIMVSARSSTAINNKLKSHVLAASALGVGRVAVLSPSLVTQDTATATGDAAPGVGANRDERVFYSWPGAQTFIPEAVNVNIARADSGVTADGILDVPGNGWLAAVCSNLPPERNPGQAAAPVPQVLAPVLGIQRGVPSLTMNDYIILRQKGVAGLRIDRTVGPVFQSGITTSLIAGQKNINRRRMADFIEDSLAQRLVQFSKLPLTNQLRDAAVNETVAFLDELLSQNNPAAQRIDDFEVDSKSGNTPDLTAKGIYVIIVRVRTLATADFIVVQAEIGEGVVITRTA